jgi:hypothetical protein
VSVAVTGAASGGSATARILDVAFKEDDPPWIEQNPRATVVVMVLRRSAYTLLAPWRGVTLRSDEQRNRPWRKLMRNVELAPDPALARDGRGAARPRRSPPLPLDPSPTLPRSLGSGAVDSARRGPISAEH